MTYAEVFAELRKLNLGGDRWSLTVNTWHRPGREPSPEWELYVSDGIEVDSQPSGEALLEAVRAALAPRPVGNIADVGAVSA